jgi:hypothetical protein
MYIATAVPKHWSMQNNRNLAESLGNFLRVYNGTVIAYNNLDIKYPDGWIKNIHLDKMYPDLIGTKIAGGRKH